VWKRCSMLLVAVCTVIVDRAQNLIVAFSQFQS
jgi:hypothetical protein